MRRTILVLAAAAALAAPGLAGEPAAGVKEAIAYFDKYAPKAKDDGRYADLVHELVVTDAPEAAERIGAIFFREKNVEHHLIAADALNEFPRGPARESAGKALRDALAKADLEVDVQGSVVNSLGKLAYKPAVPVVCELMLKADDPWLQTDCVRALGSMEDLHALPALLEMLERYPVGYKWEGGEVNVDTGAAGDADQKEAERQYHEKYGNQKKKGKPPVKLYIYMQEMKKTIRRITNEPSLNNALDLRWWMEDRREMLAKLGIEIPKYKGSKPLPEREKAGGAAPAREGPAGK